MPQPTLPETITAFWASYQAACRTATRSCADQWVQANRAQWQWLGQCLDWSVTLGRLMDVRPVGDSPAPPAETASEPAAPALPESNVIRFPSSRG